MLVQDGEAADKHWFYLKDGFSHFPHCILSTDAFCHSCQDSSTLANNWSQWFVKTDFKPELSGAVSQERFLRDVRLNWWITLVTTAWWCSISLLTSQGQWRRLKREKAKCTSSWRASQEVWGLRKNANLGNWAKSSNKTCRHK